jgi:hypothetical protein
MTGLTALVVQDAFDEIVHVASLSSLIPISTVAPSDSSLLAGAVITTRFAPAVMCACASRIR